KVRVGIQGIPKGDAGQPVRVRRASRDRRGRDPVAIRVQVELETIVRGIGGFDAHTRGNLEVSECSSVLYVEGADLLLGVEVVRIVPDVLLVDVLGEGAGVV